MPQLQIDYAGTSTSVHLKDRGVTVGRSNRATLRLPDSGLADVHFRIEPKEKGWRLKALATGEATCVNGRPVVATRMRDGDVIEAGALRCTFMERTGAASQSAARAPARSEESAEFDEADRPARRSRRPARKPVLPWVMGGIVGAVAVIALVLSRGDDEEAAAALWRQANAHIETARLEPKRAADLLTQAQDALDRLLTRYPKSKVAANVGLLKDSLGVCLGQLKELSRQRRALAGEEDARVLEEGLSRVRRLAAEARREVKPGVDALVVDLATRLQQAHDRAVDEARKGSAVHRDARRFGDALQVLREFRRRHPQLGRAVEPDQQQLQKVVKEAYAAALRVALREKDFETAIDILEAGRPTFRGTRHADDLEVRIAGLRIRKALAEREAVVRTPKGGTPDPKTPSKPKEWGPYKDPVAVVALVEERRYSAALQALARASQHPLSEVRLWELKAVADLLADLGEAVRRRPEAFENVLLIDRTRGNALGADAEGIELVTDAGRIRAKWKQISSRVFPRLLSTAGLIRSPQLGTFILYDDLGLKAQSTSALLAFFKTGIDRDRFTRILARRRGVAPPKGGYVLHGKEIISAAERDARELRARIERLVQQGASPDPKRRAAAWDELKTLGAPGQKALVASKEARLDAVAVALKSHKAFRRTKVLKAVGKELRARRAHALKMILDPRAYPYPNKSEAAQTEVEKRVERVRDLYDRTYAFMLSRSEGAKQLDTELQNLEQELEEMGHEFETRYDGVVETVKAKVDMNHLALDGKDADRIAYNDKVLEYNRTVETSADEEEKANVLAVNEYRWMMGLRAVKIDERLVRAARKHSIEMRQLKYFAHDSPTPHLKTPTQRANREGYGAGVAENIAMGPGTGRAAFWAWYGSSGHHRNMLQARHTELGCGADSRRWWTQKFGSLTGRKLTPPTVPEDPDPPGSSGNGRPSE